MSEYFRVLNRIRDEQSGGQTPIPMLARLAPAPAGQRPIPPVAKEASGPSRYTEAGFRELFDRLRALDGTGPNRALVFAGVTADEPVRTVTGGLAAYVGQLGVEVLRAELADWNGRPILRRRTDAAAGRGTYGDSLPLDLGAPAAQVELTDWFEGAAGVADLVIVEGRPLTASIDAALLARACGGLIIVAQAGVTHRDGLQAAAARACESGCRVLGVVMYGGVPRASDWLSRLLTRRAPRRAAEEQ